MKRRYAASTMRARLFRERSRPPSTAIPPSCIEAKIAREPPPQIAVDILRTICRVALYLVVGGVTPMNQALASQSSAITSSTAPTAQIARLAPRLLLVAAATGLAVTAAAAFLDPAIGQPHHGAYIASGVVMSIVDFLTAVGL